MSDIGLDWGQLDYLAIALVIGAPGLAIGAIAWRRHRLWGALIGVIVGWLFWLGGFVLWKASPWG